MALDTSRCFCRLMMCKLTCRLLCGWFLLEDWCSMFVSTDLKHSKTVYNTFSPVWSSLWSKMMLWFVNLQTKMMFCMFDCNTGNNHPLWGVYSCFRFLCFANKDDVLQPTNAQAKQCGLTMIDNALVLKSMISECVYDEWVSSSHHRCLVVLCFCRWTGYWLHHTVACIFKVFHDEYTRSLLH